jgi:hypothetical protein
VRQLEPPPPWTNAGAMHVMIEYYAYKVKDFVRRLFS